MHSFSYGWKKKLNLCIVPLYLYIVEPVNCIWQPPTPANLQNENLHKSLSIIIVNTKFQF